ncbi:hypothetical protein TPHA_0E01350 [Tetrapisispora phaffii CBS 4417]|uniref:Fatty acid hydroxylase domain-containing protein n=1 Tax=Tetrapisispora phaffii (strain ATCC 24235 / CBS 4417 / NBRC 1672 / NRRL Y-8282 / UCD 70-5) TaxID=1071381 RepID=G8BTK2_TETPH|nr:hypothetical protein TPHA_0E01350 [Tetrapisispora phaffii CBS 4417]CCE63230.1 hypothetical protein TPHA_0E01350 [Tetrapisispora phaffii CBS 4417]
MNSTVSEKLAQLTPYGYLHSKVAPTVTLTSKENWFDFATDGQLALFLPVIAYWTVSGFYHILDVYNLAEKYRIHPPEEITSRNKVGRFEVLYTVLFQHLIQVIVAYAFLQLEPAQTTGFEMNSMWKWRQALPFWVPDVAIYYGYSYAFPFAKIFTGFVIIDTWQYWLHRLMHVNSTLYKRYHSVHHRLYVPYAYGALYNAPTEGFLLDTLGTGIAMMITQLNHKEQVILFTFATLKTVDDHCGFTLPFDPFPMIFPNNTIYHDIHHQNWGIKYNYGQPFFTFWDTLFSTDYKGIDSYKEKQKQITLEKYKEFLKERKQKKN